LLAFTERQWERQRLICSRLSCQDVSSLGACAFLPASVPEAGEASSLGARWYQGRAPAHKEVPEDSRGLQGLGHRLLGCVPGLVAVTQITSPVRWSGDFAQQRLHTGTHRRRPLRAALRLRM